MSRFPSSYRRSSVTESPLSRPLTTWSGIDVAKDDERGRAEIAEFFGAGYIEALARVHPELTDVERYELLATDRHGGFGAKFLTAVTWGSDQESDENAASSGQLKLPGAPKAWNEGTTTAWSLLYRHVAETGPMITPPHAIYLVGVNPPPGITDEDRATFVEFYTSVHVPEVAKRRHCTRATVYELDRELVRPNEGSPQFLGAYEVADAASVVTRHVGFGYTKGPSVWEKHKTPWRLWYRRMAN
jgi:hypothetical protein